MYPKKEEYRGLNINKIWISKIYICIQYICITENADLAFEFPAFFICMY